MSYNSLFGYGTHSPDATLLFHVRQQETSGTALADRSGNSRDMTTSGSPTLGATGPNSWLLNAVSWNGTDQDASFASDVGTLVMTDQFSIVGWIKPVVENKEGWIFCNSTQTARGWSLRQFGNVSSEVRFRFAASQANTQAVFSDTTASTDWMSLVCVNDAGTVQFYRNGVAFGSDTPAIPDNRIGNVNLRFGSMLGANYLDALTAGWSIFDRVLTAGEAAEAASGPEPLNTAPPTLTITKTAWSGTIGSWDSQLNATIGGMQYAWELRDADDDSVVESGTGASPSGTGTYSGNYYLWVRGSNDGGFDTAEDSVSITKQASDILLLQSSTEETGTGSATVSLTGVTAGSTIAVVLFQTASGTRTYSATDYTSAIAVTGVNRHAVIFYRESVAAGSHSITVNANLGVVPVVAQAFEFSACTFSVADAIVEGVNNTDHHCAAIGALDVSGDALILSGGILNANGTTLGVTTGATRLNSTFLTTILSQYEVSGSGFVDERSTWTSSISRTGINVSAGFVAAGAGGPTYTITCTVGSFAFTGVASGLTASRKITASQSTFALSGINASLISTRKLTAAVQSIALTGVDAGLIAARSLGCGVGSFASSGVDAGLIASRSIVAASGAFALSGVDAGLIASRSIVAASGAFALSGIDTTLTYSGSVGPTYTLACSAGSFALTGVDASLVAARTITATPQSFALTGVDTGLLAARLIGCTVESLALSGVGTGLLASRMIAGSSESFVLAGIDASLDYSGSLGPTHTLAATTASFALTGIDAGTIASRLVSASTTTFALTGQDAQPLANRQVSCSMESFALTGVTANLLAGRIISATAESFVLDGKAAQLAYSGQTGSFILQYYYHLGA